METQSITRIVVRPYASALPLGCFAFGVGNALLSAYTFHWIGSSDTHLLAAILLAFVAPLELISCIMAFLSRDTGSATAMGIFSAAWVVQGILLIVGAPHASSVLMGIFLFLLSLLLAMLSIVSFPSKPLLGILLLIAIVRSFFAALVQFGSGPMSERVAGWAGLLLAAFAFYSGFGFLLEDVRLRSYAMTFRRGEAKAAFEGDLQQQMKHVSHEAGVRQQL